MSMRAVLPVSLLCLALIAGCPSEEEAAMEMENDGGSGGSSGESGEGGESGESGEGGESGAGGSDVGTPEDAANGMCGMMEDVAGCTGLDDYQTCLNDTCVLAQCYEGPCAEQLDCLRDADNACQAARDGTCPQPAACTECLTADQNCIISCFSALECGDGTAGEGGAGGSAGEAGTGGLPEGTCDELDACCTTLPEEEAMGCAIVAESARTEGDFACAVYIDAFCPTAP